MERNQDRVRATLLDHFRSVLGLGRQRSRVKIEAQDAVTGEPLTITGVAKPGHTLHVQNAVTAKPGVTVVRAAKPRRGRPIQDAAARNPATVARVAKPGEWLRVQMPDGSVKVIKAEAPDRSKIGYIDTGKFRKDSD